MNNDLTKLSQKELEEKKRKIFESADCILELNASRTNEYNRKVQKRWVNPVKLLSLKRQLDLLSSAHDPVSYTHLTLPTNYSV